MTPELIAAVIGTIFIPTWLAIFGAWRSAKAEAKEDRLRRSQEAKDERQEIKQDAKEERERLERQHKEELRLIRAEGKEAREKIYTRLNATEREVAALRAEYNSHSQQDVQIHAASQESYNRLDHKMDRVIEELSSIRALIPKVS